MLVVVVEVVGFLSAFHWSPLSTKEASEEASGMPRLEADLGFTSDLVGNASGLEVSCSILDCGLASSSRPSGRLLESWRGFMESTLLVVLDGFDSTMVTAKSVRTWMDGLDLMDSVRMASALMGSGRL